MFIYIHPKDLYLQGEKINMKNNKKGFTLMEMLIVVAIIAVLVAIAIPVLNSTLEKSREAVDAANLRSAYAECAVKVLEGEYTDADAKTYSKEVEVTQTQKDWINTTITEIAGVAVTTTEGQTTTENIPSQPEGNAWKVTVGADGTVTFAAKGA